GLAKKPDDRYATTSGFVAAVREAIGESRLGELGPPDFGPSKAPTPVTDVAVERTLVPAPAPARSRRARTIIAVGLIAFAGLGAAIGAILAGGGVEETVPGVPAGAQPLGSELAAPDRSLDCRGRPPGSSAAACAIVQTALPGAQLVAPADGAIV